LINIKKTNFFLLIISFLYILKEGIIIDHWNVFMMESEEDDLGEMEPSNLVGVGPSNLGGAGVGPSNIGGAGPSGIGGVEPTKKHKKG
jgi:hypothetical protein